jgi:hypothetical protein
MSIIDVTVTSSWRDLPTDLAYFARAVSPSSSYEVLSDVMKNLEYNPVMTMRVVSPRVFKKPAIKN